jgi:hypothetical protein
MWGRGDGAGVGGDEIGMYIVDDDDLLSGVEWNGSIAYMLES